MPILNVRHVTKYRYRQPVGFGEHRLMLRPRESYDQWMIESRLDIAPKPAELRWTQDVFGNAVGIARFDKRAEELCLDSSFTLEHEPLAADAFGLEDYARQWPFAYGVRDMPDLTRSIERQHLDPDRVLADWARGFTSDSGRTDTEAMLAEMTRAIRADFAYLARESGVQSPLETLRLKRGTCRDFAVLMIEAVRSLGLAARFVSGYLYSPGADKPGEQRLGGGSTHAWVRVYLPGPGWVEFDPTNGIVGNTDLIRVAIARDPAQASPISGTFIGFPHDFLSMNISVNVTEASDVVVPAVAARS